MTVKFIRQFYDVRIIVGVWVAIASVFCFIVYDIISSRASEQTQALFQITSYVRLVSEQAVAVFDRTNSVLSHARDAVTNDDLLKARVLEETRRRDIQAKLTSFQAEAFGVVSISLTDADGYVFANTVGRAPGDNLSDRAYFLKLRSSNVDQAVISEAIMGRVSNKWGLQMARSLRFPDGRFAGMIVANLSIAGFVEFYKSLDLVEGTAVLLKDSDDRLLARYPVQDNKYGIKIPVGDDVIVSKKDNDNYVYHRNAIVDNKDRLYSYRRLPRYGISATVGVLDWAYLSEWYQIVLRDIALFLLVIFGGVATTLGVGRLRIDEQKLRQAHSQLMDAHETLKTTQHYLIQSEKAASLGQVVARASHEINTPIGVALTSASHLGDRIKEMATKFREAKLRKSEMIEYINDAEEICSILISNLHRAAELICSFRQVASDQFSEEARNFELAACVSEVVHIFSPMWRKCGHQVDVICSDAIDMHGYPGVISQIITNFLTNSFMHGFDEGIFGNIKISITTNAGGVVELRYCDNGNGIPEELRDKIFEPFFTTRRNSGGTGLGLHIVQNLVYAKLRGTIDLKQNDGDGVCFIIKFPKNVT